ncbi:MAG: hypothetical protein II937_02195 [Bacteroidales bacterium]|nr:hypothetical protein [Bacteroidales bacterium]
MKKLSLVILLIVLFGKVSLAQGELDTTKKVLYRNEWSLSMSLKTNGLEFDYRSGKFVNYFKKNLWDCGISFIKHPQQYRASNPYVADYGQFCFGKKNFCFEFFYSRGRQRSLFQKQDLNTVEIRLFYMVGASLAFLKPIYYEIYYSGDDVRSEKFDPVNHYATITLGTSSFVKGFDEISVVPGAEFKGGLSFEFGKNDKKLVALETGFKISAYAKKLEIMAQKKNPQFIGNLFIAMRLGRIKHGAHYEYLNEYEKEN